MGGEAVDDIVEIVGAADGVEVAAKAMEATWAGAFVFKSQWLSG